MSTVRERLEQEMNRIRFDAKTEYDKHLTETDIQTIFTVLKKEDQELKPVLECFQKIFAAIPQDQCLLREETLIQLLKYYNLIENTDIMNIRHKLFFTENKQLIKKPFFSADNKEKIKQKIQSIFEKL